MGAPLGTVAGRTPLDSPPPGPRPQPAPQGSIADVPPQAAPALNDTQVVEAMMSAGAEAEQILQRMAQIYPEGAPTLVQIRDMIRQVAMGMMRSTSTPQGGMGALAPQGPAAAGVPF